MDQRQILEELLDLLRQNGLDARIEHLGGRGGGLCKLKSVPVLFVDSDATVADRLAVCAQALRDVVDIETVYLKPQVREFLESSYDDG